VLFCATATTQTLLIKRFTHSFYRHGVVPPYVRECPLRKRVLRRRKARRSRGTCWQSATRQAAAAGRLKPAATLAVFVGDAGEAFDQNRGAFFVLSVYASEGLSTIGAGSHIVDDVNRGVLAAQLHGGGFAVSHVALHLNSQFPVANDYFFVPVLIASLLEGQSLCQWIETIESLRKSLSGKRHREKRNESRRS